MEDKPKLQPYGDIVTVTGKYMKDGKERNRYQKVGMLFATPHFSRVTIKLDALPIGGDGWLSVFERKTDETAGSNGYSSFREQGERLKQKQDDVILEDTGEPINLDEIPF